MTGPIVNLSDIQDVHLPSPARGIDLSNCGELLAIAHSGPGATIQVLRTQDGSILHHTGQWASRAWSVAFTEEGKALHFVTWDEDNQAELWRLDLASKKTRRLRQYSASERVRHLARDTSGRFLAVIGNQIFLWDLAARRPVAIVTGANPDWVLQAVFANNSPRLVIYGLEPGQLVLFDPKEEQALQRWEAPTDIGEQVATSLDGRFIVACGRSYSGVALHDTQLGRRVAADTDGIQEFTKATMGRSFAFTSDGRYLVLLRGRVHFFRLPEVTRLDPGESIHGVGARATCSSVARLGSTLAFAIEEEKRVLWFDVAENSLR